MFLIDRIESKTEYKDLNKNNRKFIREEIACLKRRIKQSVSSSGKEKKDQENKLLDKVNSELHKILNFIKDYKIEILKITDSNISIQQEIIVILVLLH